MNNTAILIGRLLVLLGAIGYGYGLYNGNASFTALIPAIFGIVIMACGHIANAKENLRKHMMHLAVLVALIGFAFPAWRLLAKASELTLSFAVIMQAAMALLCLVFVVLSVRSFVAARRSAD